MYVASSWCCGYFIFIKIFKGRPVSGWHISSTNPFKEDLCHMCTQHHFVATEGAPSFKVVRVAVLLSRTFPPISNASVTCWWGMANSTFLVLTLLCCKLIDMSNVFLYKCSTMGLRLFCRLTICRCWSFCAMGFANTVHVILFSGTGGRNQRWFYVSHQSEFEHFLLWSVKQWLSLLDSLVVAVTKLLYSTFLCVFMLLLPIRSYLCQVY